jgi:hypothetical protein
MTDETVWARCSRCGQDHDHRIVGRRFSSTPGDPGVPLLEPLACPDPPPLTRQQMLEKMGQLAGEVLGVAADARDWSLAERACEALGVNDPRPKR